MPLYEFRHLFICSEALNLFKMENQGTIMRVPWEPKHTMETLDLLAPVYS
jgi:sulfur relay (sulfurtransferase) DsrF/TusC family protein